MKKLLPILFCLFIIANAHAASYTAVLSGNLSNSATWGGVAPPVTLSSGDVINIPLGITVNMDQNMVLNSNTTLNVISGGELKNAGSSILIISGGELKGGGNVITDSMSVNFTTASSFSGRLEARALHSLNTNFTSIDSLIVGQRLELAGGVMKLGSGTTRFGNFTTITVRGGYISLSGGATLLTKGAYHLEYISSNAVTGPELTLAGLMDLTVDVGTNGFVTMSDDATPSGTVTLNSGELVLNGNHLTIIGDFSSSGSGTITGSNISDLTIATNVGVTGALRFTSGANTVENFNLIIGNTTGEVKLAGDLNISSLLNLMAGVLNVQGNELKFAAASGLTQGSSDAYVRLGAGGRMTKQIPAGVTDTFPVAVDQEYLPVTVTAIPGSAISNISVGVEKDVKEMGATGTDVSLTEPMVDATWFIESDVTTNLNLDISVMWSASMEVNGFDRSQVYISHYTNGKWDASATAAAGTSGTMYTATRTGITSLSPFAVFDANTKVSVEEIISAENNLYIYPNPAAEVINVDGVNQYVAESWLIIDVTGKVIKRGPVSGKNLHIPISELSKGVYLLQIQGEDRDIKMKFVK